MAATVQIRRLAGSGPTSTDISGINTRANAYDAHSTADTSNPINIPASGTNFSYWVTTRLHCTVAPSVLINNLRWYRDGAASDTGVDFRGNSATAYTQATGTPGVTGDELTAGAHGNLNDDPVTLSTWLVGGPLSLAGSTSTTGAFGEMVVYQQNVDSTAAPGATTAVTMTYKWDEV